MAAPNGSSLVACRPFGGTLVAMTTRTITAIVTDSEDLPAVSDPPTIDY